MSIFLFEGVALEFEKCQLIRYLHRLQIMNKTRSTYKFEMNSPETKKKFLFISTHFQNLNSVIKTFHLLSPR